MKLLLLSLLTTIFAFGQGTSAQDCQNLKKNIATATDQKLFHDCGHYFWGQGDYDALIQIAYRRVELDPKDAGQYNTAALLRYSQWVSSDKKNKGAYYEAIGILRAGLRNNPTDPYFLLETGLDYAKWAKAHRDQLFAKESLVYLYAYLKIATDIPAKHQAQVLNTTGEVERSLGNLENAVTQALKAQEFYPESRYSKRLLKLICENDQVQAPTNCP